MNQTYVYIVIDRKQGFIYGAYANREHAQSVFESLLKGGVGEELCISQEPFINSPAHFAKEVV